MKNILLSTLLLAGPALPAAADPKTYAEVQNDLGWLSVDAAAYRKNLKDGIQRQATNLAVMNQLELTRAKVDEMIRRDNITKACKVAEVGFTVATLGVGGVAAAGANSLMTAAGMKEAGKYIAQKGAVEIAKETAGVPGYSDAVKAGMFVFNKVDENDIRAQLGKGDIDLLLEAKRLIENDDGRTLKEKLPELRDIMSRAGSRLEETGAAIKASASLIDSTIEKAKVLTAEAEKLKEAEDKRGKEEYEKARLKQASGLLNTDVSRPADVPPPPAVPKEDEEARRRRMQEAITKYISSLAAKYKAEEDAGIEAWAGMKDSRSADPGGADQLLQSLNYLQENMGAGGGYMQLQSREESAKSTAKALGDYLRSLEQRAPDVKASAEPPLGRMAGIAAQWRSIREKYSPLGYHVPEEPDAKKSRLWSYYEGELNYIERYKAETGGLEGKFSALAAAAAGQKDAVYAAAAAAAQAYAAAALALKEALPQQDRLQAAIEEVGRKKAPVQALPFEFAAEFGHDGKRDLADLEPKIAAAKRAYAEAQAALRGALQISLSLSDKLERERALSQDPLCYEARNIAAGAANPAHKSAMAAIFKPLEDFRPSLDKVGNLEGLPNLLQSSADIIFGADDAMRYLRDAERRMLAAVSSGAAGLKSAFAALDTARLQTASDEEYNREFEKIGKAQSDIQEKLQGIQEEVKTTDFFTASGELRPQKLEIKNSRYGPMVEGRNPPLFFNSGFWPASVSDKLPAVDKVRDDFWNSARGRALAEARRVKEYQDAANRRDPGIAAVKKMYEDFARAYESRDAARTMSYISEDWTAGDGTTASDLEEHFRSIFRVYDEIKVSVSDLNVINDAPGLYTASYSIGIRSRIYKKNIKREENSSVYEKVALEGGTPRITRTDSGGYWEIK